MLEQFRVSRMVVDQQNLKIAQFAHRLPAIATSRARSDIPSSELLHPDIIRYGARSSTASIWCSLPFSTLNSSAISQVHGWVGPATTARPLGVSKWRVFPAA